MPFPSSYDFWDRAADVLWWFIATTCVLWFLAVLGYQCFFWLYEGRWHPLPSSLLFDHFGVSLEHVYSPKEWLGAAAIARWVLDLPLSVLPPMIVAAFTAQIQEAVHKK